MKWIFGLVVLLLVVFIVVKRDQIYVRDPLSKVTHNGIEENGAQVFINFNNEVLVENDNPPMHLMLIQQNNHVGVPKQINCIHWVACMVDAPVATFSMPLDVKVQTMTEKQVLYTDADRTESVITLR
ncbi:hypothetical protein ACFQBQ_10615 [Granulicella cerasi]|uniref:NusG domain-containing protein n=1 Tax=Granulicella cerasi TaxID=741063 RepID=A0ABW1ZC80_9BACT|nr:hypothetical protein [Granulicella cerasi]